MEIKQEQQRSQILDKCRILFMRYGIKSMTMDDVARELGMSKKTLYQFFENKADLVRNIAEKNTQRDIEFTKDLQTRAVNALDEMFQVAAYVIEEMAEIMSPTAIYDLQKYYPELWADFEKFQNEQIHGHIRHNIERGISEGLYRSDLDADIIAKLYVTKTMCFVDESIFPMKIYDKRVLFYQFLSYHIRGIATPKGLKVFERYSENLKLS
jgi:TetR/AcrR family transcriptional regulator, cholesterol catabolism regulator